LTVELLLSDENCKDKRKRKKRRRESESGETTADHLLPFKVRAYYNGQMKEMEETCRGTWAIVSWFNQSHIYETEQYDQSDSDGSCPEIDKAVMHYQLILEFEDTTISEGVLTHLSNLLDNQSMADVTFVVKNEKIGAHSIIVSGSPVICAMLEKGKFKEGRTRTVEIEDIEPAVFKEMLRHLYTGKAPPMEEDEEEMIEPLFLAADKYQIKALKDFCARSLTSKLNMQTVVHYLVLAHLHSAPQLLEASFRFLVSHKKEVWTRPEWKKLMKTYPDLFYLASHRMSV
jgi:BTB/POZ domain